MEKTMVMKILEQKKIKYNPYFYEPIKLDAVYVAETLNQDPKRVFKTLVAVGSKYYVFMIPAFQELDLKKAARALSVRVSVRGAHTACGDDSSYAYERRSHGISQCDRWRRARL